MLRGHYAVGLFAYELSDEAATHSASHEPLAEILLFKHCQHLSAAEVDAWLVAQKNTFADEHPAGIANVHASVNEKEFTDAVALIKNYIEAGDTYQVNYTYRLRFDTFGTLHKLYQRLRHRQPVPYGALISLPDGRAVLSLSPELFVQHRQGELTARPMKGTAPATGNTEQDAVSALALSNDKKNRAENVMVVDLLRNDLGKIAKIGSVRVSKLFNVTRYSSVLQMTSTVNAEMRDDVTLAEIFTALYPCGSITGAPKPRTMQIIREVETAARGIYTGAIGWFDAPTVKHRVGDFCLSVPIRTLALQAPGADGIRKGEIGVGAGIVYDSVTKDEYAECQLKARFLTGLPNEFELFETMYATSAGCRHQDRHWQRLKSSASYFGFLYDEALIHATLHETCAALTPDETHRVRLALNQAGICSVQTGPIKPLPEPVRILLSNEQTHADDLFLRHKSTVRERYDAAWRTAENQGAFDMLFCNSRGELTEGGRTNIFVKLDGAWYTPPLTAGVLPGVMRAVLLTDPAWNASERVLTLDDLRKAEKIVVCNALRGPLDAIMDWN